MESVAKVGGLEGKERVGSKALESLLSFIDEHKRRAGRSEDGFEAFEREVRQRFAEAEREFVGEELERLDVSLPEVRIDGVLYRRVLHCPFCRFPDTATARRERTARANARWNCAPALSKVSSRRWRLAWVYGR